MTKERELLRRALEDLETHCGEGLELKKEIRAYLAAEPEAEPEPVAYQWLHSGHFRKQIPKNANAIEWYPLYLHPPKPAEPARKPMTAKEMLKGIDADTYPYEEVLAFVTGIRFAEKHHGIGGKDE